jgi:large subunit ribosomal protein L9
MKVILLTDVKGKGKRDQVIEVPDGYARNYLFAKKLAVAADAVTLNELKGREASKQYKYDTEKAAAVEAAKQLEAITLVLRRKAGVDNKLYGAITTKEIVQQLKQEHNLEVDKKKLSMEGPIKAFGTYKIKAKLFSDVSATITVQVIEE